MESISFGILNLDSLNFLGRHEIMKHLISKFIMFQAAFHLIFEPQAAPSLLHSTDICTLISPDPVPETKKLGALAWQIWSDRRGSVGDELRFVGIFLLAFARKKNPLAETKARNLEDTVVTEIS